MFALFEGACQFYCSTKLIHNFIYFPILKHSIGTGLNRSKFTYGAEAGELVKANVFTLYLHWLSHKLLLSRSPYAYKSLCELV